MKDIDPAPDEWQTRTHELAIRLGLSRLRRFAWCRAGCLRCSGRLAAGPVAGAGRAMVVDEPRRADVAVAARAAHLKRRDHWVRWLELIVGGLYWWHPVVWWGRRLLREAEEQCCDAWVVWAMPLEPRPTRLPFLSAIEFVSGARPPRPRRRLPAGTAMSHA